MTKKHTYIDNSERSVNNPEVKQNTAEKMRSDGVKSRDKLRESSPPDGTRHDKNKAHDHNNNMHNTNYKNEIKREKSKIQKMDSTRKLPKRSSSLGKINVELLVKVIKNKRVNRPKQLSSSKKTTRECDTTLRCVSSIKSITAPHFDVRNLPKTFTPRFRISGTFIEKYVAFKNSAPKEAPKDTFEKVKSDSSIVMSKEEEDVEVNEDGEAPAPSATEIPVTFFLNKDRSYKSQLSTRRMPRHLIPMEFYAKKMTHLWDESVSYDLVKQSMTKHQTSANKLQTISSKSSHKDDASFRLLDNEYSSGVAHSKTLKVNSTMQRKLINNCFIDNHDVFPYHYFDDTVTVEQFLKYVDPLYDEDDPEDGAS